MTRGTPRLAIILLAATLMVSCADTVIEVDSTDAPIGTGADAPTTTLPTGTTIELLDEMAALMRGLNTQVADEGDEKATLAEIEAIWIVARPDVESTHPELLNGIDTAVEMARTAVGRVRPADADKATQILDAQIERYNDG